MYNLQLPISFISIIICMYKRLSDRLLLSITWLLVEKFSVQTIKSRFLEALFVLKLGCFQQVLLLQTLCRKKSQIAKKTQHKFISSSFTEIRIDIRIIDLGSHDSCYMNVSRGVGICTTSSCETPKTFLCDINYVARTSKDIFFFLEDILRRKNS